MTLLKNIWTCLWSVVVTLIIFFLAGAIMHGLTISNFYFIIGGIIGLSVIVGILKTVLDRWD